MKSKQILLVVPVLLAGVAGAQQDEKPRTPHVVISQSVADKLLIKRVEPDYPEDVKATHMAGQVVVWMVIGKEGDVTQAVPVARDLANRKSINADDLRLRNATANAVKLWKYRPYRMPGRELVEVGTSVVLRFDFTGEQAPVAAALPPGILHLVPGAAGPNKIHDVAPGISTNGQDCPYPGRCFSKRDHRQTGRRGKPADNQRTPNPHSGCPGCRETVEIQTVCDQRRGG